MGLMAKQFTLILNAKDQASSAVKQMTDSLEKANKSIGSVGKSFKNFNVAGLAIGATIIGIGALANRSVDAADGLSKLSDKTGVSIEKLSVMSEVASASGVSVEDLQKSLSKMSVNSSKTPELFESIGISVKDTAGKLKSADEIFAETADYIAGIADPAKQAAEATRLMGEDGIKLLPILKAGSAGIKGWADDAERLGAVVSTDLSKSSAEFNDNLQRIGLISKGLGNVIAETLLPSFNLMLGTFIDFTKEVLDVGDATDEASGSFESFAKNPSFDTLINALGFVLDAINGIFRVGKATFLILENLFTSVVRDAQTVGRVLGALVKRDFAEVTRAIQENNQASAESTRKLGEELSKVLDGEMMGAKLVKAYEKTKATIKAASKDMKKEMGGVGALSIDVAKTSVVSIGKQIEALSVISDAASAKAKKAMDDQKTIAAEFDALTRELSKSAPNGGTFNQKLAKGAKEEDTRKKTAAVFDKANAADESKRNIKKLADLQARLDSSREAYALDDSLMKKSRINDAERALASEQALQAMQAQRAELRAIEAEANAAAVSRKAAEDIRNSTASELTDIYRQIEQNKKDGVNNSDEIQRLRDIGAFLKKNKDEASGVFSTGQIEKYAKEIRDVANAAAKVDKDTAAAENLKVMQDTKEMFDILKADLTAIKIGIDSESIEKESNRLVDAINEKLKGLKLPAFSMPSLDMSAGSNTVPGYATGGSHSGRIHGPGTGRQDSILARFSAGEYLQPAHIMRKPGMYDLMEYIRAGGSLDRITRNKFADGGSARFSQVKTAPSHFLGLDLKTNSGNIKITPTTTQDQLNRELRKQNLRRS